MHTLYITTPSLGDYEHLVVRVRHSMATRLTDAISSESSDEPHRLEFGRGIAEDRWS